MPRKGLSLKTQQLVEDLCVHAMSWGWQQDQGDGDGVENAQANYLESRRELEAKIVKLQSSLIRKRRAISRLRQECAEAYQVVASLADLDDTSEEDVVRVLDNLSAAASGWERPHAEVLPFPAVVTHPAEPVAETVVHYDDLGKQLTGYTIFINSITGDTTVSSSEGG